MPRFVNTTFPADREDAHAEGSRTRPDKGRDTLAFATPRPCRLRHWVMRGCRPLLGPRDDGRAAVPRVVPRAARRRTAPHSPRRHHRLVGVYTTELYHGHDTPTTRYDPF